MTDGLPTFETDPLVEKKVERDRVLSTAVVELIALVSDARVDDLPSLYDVVDPDVLDTAFDRSETGLIAFPYNEHIVSILGDRTVAVYER